jgi:hypothetical protein
MWRDGDEAEVEVHGRCKNPIFTMASQNRTAMLVFDVRCLGYGDLTLLPFVDFC